MIPVVLICKQTLNNKQRIFQKSISRNTSRNARSVRASTNARKSHGERKREKERVFVVLHALSLPFSFFLLNFIISISIVIIFIALLSFDAEEKRDDAKDEEAHLQQQEEAETGRRLPRRRRSREGRRGKQCGRRRRENADETTLEFEEDKDRFCRTHRWRISYDKRKAKE